MPPIHELEQAVLSPVDLTDPPRYLFLLVALPPNTGCSHSYDSSFDDRSVDLPKSWGTIWFRVRDTTCGGHIGHATFAASPLSVICDTIHIDDDHRRRGIATQLYDLAEKVFAVPAVPSHILSDEAEAFWAKRNLRKDPKLVLA
jgi:hypothetical protein